MLTVTNKNNLLSWHFFPIMKSNKFHSEKKILMLDYSHVLLVFARFKCITNNNWSYAIYDFYLLNLDLPTDRSHHHDHYETAAE